MSVEVDLWQWRLDEPDPIDLSPDEHARAARFLFDRDRDRYVAGRARLRRILGRYLCCAPGEIDFQYGPHGRPSVAGIAFNLSHTGDLAVLAVGRDLVLGVDIEAVRPIDMAVAEAHFAATEICELRALPEVEQVAAFYRCWTRKEAYLKAKGTGLSTDLKSFSVTLGPNDPPRLNTGPTDDAAAWVFHDLAPAPGVVGAIALQTGGQALTLVRQGAG